MQQCLQSSCENPGNVSCKINKVNWSPSLLASKSQHLCWAIWNCCLHLLTFADDSQQLSRLLGAADGTDNMSLNGNLGRSPGDADAHSTGHTGHMSLGYTHILEGGHHPAWGAPSFLSPGFHQRVMTHASLCSQQGSSAYHQRS